MARRVRIAHADAWEREGRARAELGGGATRVAGARLMYSGLVARQWNGGDVIGLPVDVEAARYWYAEKSCAWGLLVPLEMDFAPGDYLYTKRCMGLMDGDFTHVAVPSDVRLREAEAADLEAYCALDAHVFGGDRVVLRQWIAPAFGVPGWTHWLAEHDQRPVGVLTVQRTDLDAGPCGTITGVGVAEPFRRRGIGAALTSHACARLFDSGATLVHLNPNTDDAARVYTRLGFREVPGLKIYAMS
jgi:ribosomal protein S18 acetylase RimI-like enzyme